MGETEVRLFVLHATSDCGGSNRETQFVQHNINNNNMQKIRVKICAF